MTFDILWTPTAKVHLQYWQKHNPKQVDKIRAICQSISQDPTIGIGKPERLKFFGENVWSRRINQEHRLIYKISSNRQVFIIQAKYHY